MVNNDCWRQTNAHNWQEENEHLRGNVCCAVYKAAHNSSKEMTLQDDEKERKEDVGLPANLLIT